MKKLFTLLLVALLFALPAMAETAEVGEPTDKAIDVQGFWYSDEVDDGIDLTAGVATVSDEEGVTIAEGTYTVEGNKVTIAAGGKSYVGTVEGNGMALEMPDGLKRYARDGIEENYWKSVKDDSAIQLFDGRVWQYNNDGDLIGEGTYVMDGDDLTITIGSNSFAAVVERNMLTFNGEQYTRM